MIKRNDPTQNHQSHTYKQEHLLGMGTGDYRCIKCGHITSNKELDTTKCDPKKLNENHTSDC